MRDYSKVSGLFWTGKTGRSLRGDMQSQILALYLMTSPHSNMIGVFNCPIVYMAHETGSPIEGASKGLQRLCELDYCTYDEESELIWVHEMAKYQIGDGLKASDNRVKDIQKQYASLPEGRIKQGFYDKYGSSFHLQEPEQKPSPSKAPSEAPSKPLRSQKQEQEQKQNQEQNKDTGASQGDASPLVRKKSRGVTLCEWLKDIKAKGEKPVSDYQTLWEHVQSIGIPEDWVGIAWLKFKERYTTDEKAKRKLYKDWRRVFLRAIDENWMKLWYWSDGDNQFKLTTVGVTADLATRESA